MTKLEGYKTYIVAGVLAIVVAVEVFLGIDVPGVEIDHDNWLPYLLNAAGLGSLRAGISTLTARRF